MDFTLFDTLFEAICIVNQELEIVYYNHHFSTFTKSSPRIIKNKKYIQLIIENQFVQDQIKATNTNKNDFISKEEIITLGDLTEYHVILKTKYLEKENLVLIAINDISIEKNLYIKYRYQIEELKDVHQQIIKADKLSTIGEITASISHEVSNPLTIASGTSELIVTLLEDNDINPQKELLSSCIFDVREALLRIENIIKGMKKFLHGNEDKKEYTTLESILDQSQKLLASPIKKYDITIKSNYDSKAKSLVYVNELKMEQLFINLIKNSIDAINARKEIETKFSGEINIDLIDTDYMHEILISDNGIGIKNEIQDKIFDSFFTTKDVGEGTGLGLAISLKIIESYQGTINLVPTEHGTCFKITIPKMKALNLVNSTLLKEDSLNTSKNILIIDDELKILNLINESLTSLGHNTLCASNLEDALGLVNEKNIDLIFCDYQFPKTTGDIIVKEIRKLAPVTPIIYLTAKSNEEKISEDLRSGLANDLLEKPFNNDSLLAMIAKWSTKRV